MSGGRLPPQLTPTRVTIAKRSGGGDPFPLDLTETT